MNKRKAKGSVLYTVISVMMVLFVFVMVTLALARAANDRAYNSYNLRQARISAETVAKTVSEAITSNDKSDGLYTAITTKIDAASSDDISIAVSNLPAGMGHLVDPRDHSDKSIVLLEFSGMDRIGQNFISGSGQAIYKVCASVRVGKQIYDYEEYVYQEVTAEQNPNPTPAMLTYGSGTNDQEISLYGGTKTTNADSFIDSTGNLRISSWSDVQADYVNLGYNRFEYQGDEESDLFINSSVRQTHQSTFVLYPQNFAYIKGNLIVDGSDFRVRSITDNITSVIDVPALIIGGGAVFKNKLLLGRAGAGGTDVGGANLVVGTLSTIDNAVLDVRGNIYTFDDCVLNPDGTVNAAANPNYDMNGAPIEKGVNSLYTQASGTTELLDWTATLRANLGGIGGGNVYIGGCLDIKQSSAYKLVVNGDLVVKQNILFKQDTADITVNGNLVVLGGFVKELGDSGIKMTVAGDVYVQDWTNAPTITDESNNVIGDDTWGLADAQARANVYTDYINKLLLNSDSRVKKLEDKQITNYWERTTGGALIELVDDVDWGAEPKPTHLYKSKYDAYATQSQITPAEFAALSEAPAG
ncbi:MAG: hypothetical protein LBM93_11810, partial [Oscillospiraceae bacterium]|nr:hypothetical protein [Oscillospiraceae bacterium]